MLSEKYTPGLTNGEQFPGASLATGKNFSVEGTWHRKFVLQFPTLNSFQESKWVSLFFPDDPCLENWCNEQFALRNSQLILRPMKFSMLNAQQFAYERVSSDDTQHRCRVLWEKKFNLFIFYHQMNCWCQLIRGLECTKP